MFQWFLVNNSTGAIGTHDSTYSPLVNGTFDPNLIPSGFSVLGPYSDSSPMPASSQAAWGNPQAYLYQNGAFVSNPNYGAISLANAKSVQTAQLRAGYDQTLASGFNATIGTTQYTFGWSTDDKANLNATQKAIDQAFIAFPIQYADIHGSPVTLSSQADLNTIEQTATKFFNAQHQQVLNLIGQVNAVTTATPNAVATVEAITWQAAAY